MTAGLTLLAIAAGAAAIRRIATRPPADVRAEQWAQARQDFNATRKDRAA